MSSTTETKTQQSAQTNPYAPAIPLLQGIANQAGGISTAVSPYQTAANTLLWKEATGAPDLSAPGTNAVLNNLNTSTAPQMGMLQGVINNYMKNTNPIASNTDLNPWSTPGFSDAINALNTNIGKSVKSTFAGAGRDPTGNAAAPGMLAYQEGLAEAPLIQSQYNANVGNLLNANQGQLNAGVSGTEALTSEQLAALNQQLAGANAGVSTLPGLLTLPGGLETQAAGQLYNTPWSNLNPALSTAEGIGSMGGTSWGQGTTSQTTPALTNTIGLISGLAGLAGKIIPSDERLKENITPVAKLPDGQKIHSFSWKMDPNKTPKLGLLAQDVEKAHPSAVHEIGGVKHVDYGKAMAPSMKKLGMLQMAA